ncbi:hypothetical protein [Paenibacillus terrigena]|uniref:hypothetical protein n=1 Tax=Paenibacillus terrigena TaxID=369333 RepID=UPI0028D52E75|nr:hypothetical protein [Paenibacillus terrigena]
MHRSAIGENGVIATLEASAPRIGRTAKRQAYGSCRSGEAENGPASSGNRKQQGHRASAAR